MRNNEKVRRKNRNWANDRQPQDRSRLYYYFYYYIIIQTLYLNLLNQGTEVWQKERFGKGQYSLHHDNEMRCETRRLEKEGGWWKFQN